MIMGKHPLELAPTLELDFTPSTEPGMGKLILGPGVGDGKSPF